MDYLAFNRLTVDLKPFDLDEVTLPGGGINTPYRQLVCEANFPCRNLQHQSKMFVFVPLERISESILEIFDDMHLRPVSPGEFMSVCKTITEKNDDRFTKKVIIAANTFGEHLEQQRTLAFSDKQVQLFYTHTPERNPRVWPNNYVVIGTPK